MKLQRIHNKALKYALNERHHYTRNTKTNIAKIDPVNYKLYIRARNTINELTTEENETFSKIIENYEIYRNHNWFSKTINVLQRGPPNKIYTY